MKNKNQPSRRQLIKNGVLGAAAIATSNLLGQSSNNSDPGTSNPQGLELAGQVAFITGGARGIGLATAEELARQGANIVLFDLATSQIPNVGYALSVIRLP